MCIVCIIDTKVHSPRHNLSFPPCRIINPMLLNIIDFWNTTNRQQCALEDEERTYIRVCQRTVANPFMGCVTINFAILPQLSILFSDNSPKSCSITSADISLVVIMLASCGESAGTCFVELVETWDEYFVGAWAAEREKRLMEGTSSLSSSFRSDKVLTSTPSSSSIECRRNTSG